MTSLAEVLNLGFAIALLVAATLNIWNVDRRDLMMLQQNSYRPQRYIRWMEQTGESTTPWRTIDYVVLFFLLVTRIPFYVSAALAVIVCLWQALVLGGKKYKKPLVLTARAKRLLAVDLAIAAIATTLFASLMSMESGCRALMACVAVSPLLLLLSELILRPVEKIINARYLNEAKGILRSMPELKVIGITGSYGKTSTKHYLFRILQEAFPVCMTPGSFNTPMGVIRTIREHLKPYDQVFICEMGAKNIGDIKEICDIVHPQIGIVTAVGEQHLESFKTLDNVQRTKFELIDALPSDGFAVVNADFPKAAERKVTNVQCVHYGVSNITQAQYKAVDITYSNAGTSFSVVGPELKTPLQLNTQLIGECNISNLLGAVAVALHLGVSPKTIAYAVSELQQVEHRLQLTHTPGGLTIIDDAFNSNPTGAKMAMDVLGRFTQGRRIVITPGMIELGDRQATANEALGRDIAQKADIAIIVGQYNRDALLAGTAAGPLKPENVHCVDTFSQAQQLLKSIARQGDTVLYENDLPDTFK